jgi:predicted house-cleaning noncanonical NTP pyrophosphatase (MazG superfamily)
VSFYSRRKSRFGGVILRVGIRTFVTHKDNKEDFAPQLVERLDENLEVYIKKNKVNEEDSSQGKGAIIYRS